MAHIYPLLLKVKSQYVNCSILTSYHLVYPTEDNKILIKLQLPPPMHRFSFCAYFEIEMGISQMGIFMNLFKKWAYRKWAYFKKLQKNGHIANGHIPKYAHLDLPSIKKNETSTIRKFERRCNCYNS